MGLIVVKDMSDPKKLIEIRKKMLILRNLSWYEEKQDIIFKFYDLLEEKEFDTATYLLKNFLLHEPEQVMKLSSEILQELAKVVGNERIIIAGVKRSQDSERLKTSDGMLVGLRAYALKTNKLNFVYRTSENSLISVIRNKQEFKTIVFADDFIGSANTIIGIFSRLREEISDFAEKRFIVASIIMMNSAYERIKSEISPYKILTCKNLPKGISDAKDLTETGKHFFREMIADITNRNHLDLKYAFGFEESEALYSGLNTPNNTFGMFWQWKAHGNKEFSKKFTDGKEYPAIFPRDYGRD